MAIISSVVALECINLFELVFFFCLFVFCFFFFSYIPITRVEWLDHMVVILLGFCFCFQNLHTVFQHFLVAQMVKNLSAMWETRVRSLGQEDPLEKEMATHCSILACRIPWIEDLWQSMVHGVAKSQT